MNVYFSPDGAPSAAPATPPATPDASGEVGGTPVAEPALTPAQEKAVAELVRRNVQSVVDKQIDQSLGGLTKWRQEVQEATSNFDAAVAQLKASGVIPADADTSAARTKVVAEAMAKAETPDAGGDAGPDGMPKTLEEFQARITDLGAQEAARWGMPDNAPEIAMLKRDGSPEEYLASMRAAGQAYAKRTGGPSAPAGTELPMDLGGGAGTKPNPIENINDPDKLFEIAFGK